MADEQTKQLFDEIYGGVGVESTPTPTPTPTDNTPGVGAPGD